MIDFDRETGKHTPGPWVATGQAVESKAAFGLCVAVCSEEGTFVADHGYEINENEALANMTLIAAAPDLLEVLNGLLYATEAFAAANGVDYDCLSEVIAAKAAIKNARGE